MFLDHSYDDQSQVPYYWEENMNFCREYNTCSGNGVCINDTRRQICMCNDSWTGSDCNITVEEFVVKS
jgi:hypothetical protein